MTSFDCERLIVERAGERGEIVWISLANPPIRNALDARMQTELLGVLEEIKQDSSIGCVIVRGAGDLGFCSGGDIKGFKDMTPQKGDWYSVHRGQAFQRLMASMGKPVIAAVDGWCLAGGMELAVMCDFIYASETAKFAVTEIEIGLLPGWGGLSHLSGAVGLRRAREMIYSAEKIDAAEALRIGLVNKVFPTADQMYVAAERAAISIANKSRAAVREARDIITATGTIPDAETGMAMERGVMMRLISSADFHEGVQAFLEKRKPAFNTDR